jgi:hypothetical protein
MSDTLTTIYSCLPAEATDPEGITRGKDDRDTYPPLPWPLEALPGTIWRNVSTGRPLRIDSIKIDRWGQRMPVAADEANDGYPGLGLWHDQERFCIEHWVRVDHLPASAQLAWYQFEVRFRRQELGRIEWMPVTRRLMEEELAIAIRQMREFALQHNLPLPLDAQPVRTFPQSEPAARFNFKISDVCLQMNGLRGMNAQTLHDTLIAADGAVELVVPFPAIEVGTQSYLDIADDYACALFLGESLAELCQAIAAQVKSDKVRFRFIPQDIEGIVQLLIDMKPLYDEEVDDLAEEELALVQAELRNQANGFADTLDERKLHFPELGDLYLANFVVGESDLEIEEIEELHRRFPERQYEFWRSSVSNLIGFDLYVSDKVWIAPLNCDITLLLTTYGGYDNGIPDLLEATPMTFGSLMPVVFNQAVIKRYPYDKIENAQKCAEELWLNPKVHNKNRTALGTRYESKDGDDISSSDSLRVNTNVTRTFLSGDGNLLLATDTIAQYIFFSDSLLTVSADALGILHEAIQDVIKLSGGPADISCPWEDLNDDLFEQLCYDVIHYVYHPGTIYKMGKSRSRDGGRDIEFVVPPRLGKEAVKWIVQCKWIGKGGSLPASRVQISDTIDQYQAGGFCVMTSGVIDATLHDKLNAIGRNRNIETDRWSHMELERFLARYPELYQRYFARSRPGNDEE